MPYRLTVGHGTPYRVTQEPHATLEAARAAAVTLARLLGRPVSVEEWGTWYGEEGWMVLETVEPPPAS